ncbi:ECF transporter S component [Alicyclobacillus fastidiosus]|uniref:ECF transporter S component n=1 Tax=Alicyclobacillus fastidiosus TaxID=392011 RepID=A0ABV5ADD7_9BACL|nr:ECF transporter S component [Alicyclobacillus fastidiosus]WEH08686.1 ECF transporter S component [Alicyclobacillus fastidiosus]
MSAWKLRDVIVMVVLAIVAGALYRVWDILYAFIPTAVYAGQAAMTGLWMIASVLVAYIVRRPGAALLAELIAASVELVLGGQWGLSNLTAGLIQGIGAELAFLLFIYRGYHIVSCCLAGVLAALAAVLQWFFQYGGNALTAGTQVSYVIVALVSGALLGGVLPKLIAGALYRAGVLRNFAIAQQHRAMTR